MIECLIWSNFKRSYEITLITLFTTILLNSWVFDKIGEFGIIFLHELVCNQRLHQFILLDNLHKRYKIFIYIYIYI